MASHVTLLVAVYCFSVDSHSSPADGVGVLVTHERLVTNEKLT